MGQYRCLGVMVLVIIRLLSALLLRLGRGIVAVDFKWWGRNRETFGRCRLGRDHDFDSNSVSYIP